MVRAVSTIVPFPLYRMPTFSNVSSPTVTDPVAPRQVHPEAVAVDLPVRVGRLLGRLGGGPNPNPRPRGCMAANSSADSVMWTCHTRPGSYTAASDFAGSAAGVGRRTKSSVSAVSKTGNSGRVIRSPVGFFIG